MRKGHLVPESNTTEDFDFSLINKIKWRCDKRNIASNIGLLELKLRKEVDQNVALKIKELNRPLSVKERDELFDKEMDRLKRRKRKD